MKVALRADASRSIGTGHVRRCVALGAALRMAGVEVIFVTRDLGLGANPSIAASGLETLLLPPPKHRPLSAAPETHRHAEWAGVSAAQDATDTVQVLSVHEPAWVVVDHYAFDQTWHRSIAAGLRCHVAVIDDLGDRDLYADLVIDHNYCVDHRQKYAARLSPEVQILGGPRFALLDACYAEALPHHPGPKVRSVGIFMGGIDAGNATETALDALDLARFTGTVEIAATSESLHLPRWRARAASRMNTTISIDLPNLAAFFARHDLQIGAGGGATWERCAVGVPSLTLTLAANQQAVVPALAAMGVIATPQPLDSLDPKHLSLAIQQLMVAAEQRCKLATASRVLVDGLGARRVALRLAASTLKLRPAQTADAELMYGWRNHPLTREVSRDPRAIPWADHQDWLSRALADDNRRLSMGYVGEVPVGVIRFDRLCERQWEVSLYLDPTLHGLGLGLALLSAGEASLGPGQQVHAVVLPENSASCRMFRSAGYAQAGPTTWIKPVNLDDRK